MAMIEPALELECHICRWRPPPNAVMEAVLLHFQVEHDTDDVKLDLAVICNCEATMAFTFSEPGKGTEVQDHFRCPKCLNTTVVKRDPTKEG